jgi:hypothetical protein
MIIFGKKGRKERKEVEQGSRGTGRRIQILGKAVSIFSET